MKVRKIVTIIIFVLMCIVAIWQVLTYCLSSANYAKNKAAWSDTDLIYDQHLDDAGDLKYGFGSIAYNGCGAVAIYNIMSLENKKTPLPDIIKYLDAGQYVFGLLGTCPSRIVSYLRAQGFDCSLHSDKGEFERLAQESDYSIYIYAGFSGGHYTLLVNNSENTFTSINPNRTTTIKKLIDENMDQPINFLITVSR